MKVKEQHNLLERLPSGRACETAPQAYKASVVISGSFDVFSCWGVSTEKFLVGLYMRVCVFAGGCVST